MAHAEKEHPAVGIGKGCHGARGRTQFGQRTLELQSLSLALAGELPNVICVHTSCLSLTQALIPWSLFLGLICIIVACPTSSSTDDHATLRECLQKQTAATDAPAHAGPHSVAAAQSLARTADWRHSDHAPFMASQHCRQGSTNREPVPLLLYKYTTFQKECKCGGLLCGFVTPSPAQYASFANGNPIALPFGPVEGATASFWLFAPGLNALPDGDRTRTYAPRVTSSHP
jgi:hypothetical protein